MAKKFKVMASNAKEPDGKCVPKSMRKSVESACGKKSVKSSNSVKKFGIKASKSAKKRVAAAKGYWADDINAESYRKILKALDDYLIANYDGKTIGDVEIGVSELRDIKDGKGSKVEVEFYCPDYEKDTKLEIISAPDLRSKFLCRVSVDPFKFDEKFEIPQSGSKQIVVDKINEIANRLSGSAVESSCKTKKTVKASAAAKKRKAIKASDNYYDEDIVFYFNGKKQFEGSIFDLAGTVEILCHDPKVMQVFQDYCNQFGDPFDFDGTPRDTALVFTKLVMFEAEGANEPSDFYVEYSDYRNPTGGFEIFYKSDENIESAKSIKAGINAPDTEGPLCVCKYCLEAIESHEGRQVVYDEISEFDIEPEDKLICDWCEEESDRLYQISPDEVNSAKSIKCAQGSYSDFDEDMPFYVAQYYDTKFRDTAESASFDDMDEAVDYAHECLGKGPTSIEHYSVGRVDIDPDEYWENFDGEFWCTPELAEWRDEVWKSMGIGASKSIKCSDADGIDAANSLNLNAKPNYRDWMLRGYKFDGEDVTTLRIDFQDDVKQAVMDMFADPDIETVDLYKIPTEQETTGVFEDEEYFTTFTREDINSSVDIEAGITVGEDSRFDFSNPIYELDDYVKAIADGVIDRIQGITYDISKETIAFFDADNNVVFVQPIGGIIPEPDDLETDIDELSTAIQSEMDNTYARENWEQDNDDPDHASRAVELSEDIGEVDIDDLEPITGEGEDTDYGFGFDSNGNPIDESTVEELERIAQEVLDKSEIHNIDEYADLHNFNYYASIPYIQESFDISFTYVAHIYELSKNGMATDEGYYTTVAPYNIHFNVRCKNGEVEYAECTDIDVNDGYVKDVELKNFNLDALVQFATDLVNPVAMDIYNATTNL